MLNNDRVVFSLAASTDLFNKPYAIGYTVTDFDGQELENGHLVIPDKLNKRGRKSFEQFQAKKIEDFLKTDLRSQRVTVSIPHFEYCDEPESLINSIYTIWYQKIKKYREVFAITDKSYAWLKAPRLLRLAPVMRVADMIESDYPRRKSELPSDSFVNDARYQARLYITAINQINATSVKPEECKSRNLMLV